MFSNPNTLDISVKEKDGRVLALGRSEYGRLGLGDGEKTTYSIDANMILSLCVPSQHHALRNWRRLKGNRSDRGEWLH